MRVCIFGGTNPATNPKYYNAAEQVGKMLVAEGFEMVWGGNAHGVLAKIHKEYIEKNAKNTLFMPEAYKDDLKIMQTDEVVKTQTICGRAEAMLAAADIILVMPGGIGTIFEFWTAVEVRRAEEFCFEIVLFNYENFYKHQLAHYDFINENGFTKIGQGGAPYKIDPKDLFKVATTPEQVIEKLKEIRKTWKKKK
ncbi:MAG: LOG family protein [Firmicutes bacterium]|nr:LOG family protein [Bacillota bacterium]